MHQSWKKISLTDQDEERGKKNFALEQQKGRKGGKKTQASKFIFLIFIKEFLSVRHFIRFITLNIK